MKKLASLILAIIMAFSCCLATMTAFAATSTYKSTVTNNVWYTKSVSHNGKGKNYFAFNNIDFVRKRAELIANDGIFDVTNMKVTEKRKPDGNYEYEFSGIAHINEKTTSSTEINKIYYSTGTYNISGKITSNKKLKNIKIPGHDPANIYMNGDKTGVNFWSETTGETFLAGDTNNTKLKKNLNKATIKSTIKFDSLSRDYCKAFGTIYISCTNAKNNYWVAPKFPGGVIGQKMVTLKASVPYISGSFATGAKYMGCINGLEFECSKDKNFKKGVKKKRVSFKYKIPTQGIYDGTIKGLKPNTKYYVRVRGFNKEGGKKVYTTWATSSIKTLPKK